MGATVERNDAEGVHAPFVQNHELVRRLHDLQRVRRAALAWQPARLAGHVGIVLLQVLRPLGVDRTTLLGERHVDRLLHETPVSHVHDPSVGPHATEVRHPGRKPRLGIDPDWWFRRLRICRRLRGGRRSKTEKRDDGRRETPAIRCALVSHIKIAPRPRLGPESNPVHHPAWVSRTVKILRRFPCHSPNDRSVAFAGARCPSSAPSTSVPGAGSRAS